MNPSRPHLAEHGYRYAIRRCSIIAQDQLRSTIWRWRSAISCAQVGPTETVLVYQALVDLLGPSRREDASTSSGASG